MRVILSAVVSKGLRLRSAVSDRVRDVLVDLLQAAGSKVIAERPGSHRQVTEFLAPGLHKTKYQYKTNTKTIHFYT